MFQSIRRGVEAIVDSIPTLFHQVSLGVFGQIEVGAFDISGVDGDDIDIGENSKSFFDRQFVTIFRTYFQESKDEIEKVFDVIFHDDITILFCQIICRR